MTPTLMIQGGLAIFLIVMAVILARDIAKWAESPWKDYTGLVFSHVVILGVFYFAASALIGKDITQYFGRVAVICFSFMDVLVCVILLFSRKRSVSTSV